MHAKSGTNHLRLVLFCSWSRQVQSVEASFVFTFEYIVKIVSVHEEVNLLDCRG